METFDDRRAVRRSDIDRRDEVAAHLHHGHEAGYFREGGMVQSPGQPPRMIPIGQPIWNLRDVVHAGYKVVGDKPIRLVTVHVVDKGKTLYEISK